ncbi:MAG: FAD-dependent oxidoreductase, partial [Pseudomonadota bacterium]
MELPKKARAVIVGGGVSGCSVAYHLAKLGWSDVVLLERKQLTCGTTWHAAGLIGQLRPSQNLTKLARYSADLYTRLEEETGVATGMRQTGSITVALTDARMEELRRQAALARALDVAAEELSPAECLERYPHLETKDVVGGVYLPLDGQCDPANTAMALAKGARMNGALVREGVKVTGVETDGGHVTGVHWEQDGATDVRGTIATDIVINCAGMWARDFAAQSGDPAHSPRLGFRLERTEEQLACIFFVIGAFIGHAKYGQSAQVVDALGDDVEVLASMQRQGHAYRTHTSNDGRVALVLGAGNVSALIPGDFLYKLFV